MSVRSVLFWIKEHFNLLKIVRSLPAMSNDIRIPDNILDGLNNDKLKFILAQAEKKIGNMTDEANIHYTRSIAIITISLPLATGLVAYLFKVEEPWQNKVAAGVVILFLVSVCTLLKGNITPTEFRTSGTRPLTMLDPVFFDNLTEKEDGEFNALLYEVKDAEIKIRVNEQINTRRSKNLKNAIHLLYWAPLIVLAIYSVTYLFSLCSCQG